MKTSCMTLAMVGTLLAGAAGAHHSVAMYEAEKTVTVEGTVKEFQWTNPHVLLKMTADAAGGGEPQVWTIELTAPGQLSRNGWTHATLKPGDRIKVDLRPLRSGRPGGLLMAATLPNGEKIGR